MNTLNNQAMIDEQKVSEMTKEVEMIRQRMNDTEDNSLFTDLMHYTRRWADCDHLSMTPLMKKQAKCAFGLWEIKLIDLLKPQWQYSPTQHLLYAQAYGVLCHAGLFPDKATSLLDTMISQKQTLELLTVLEYLEKWLIESVADVDQPAPTLSALFRNDFYAIYLHPSLQKSDLNMALYTWKTEIYARFAIPIGDSLGWRIKMHLHFKLPSWVIDQADQFQSPSLDHIYFSFCNLSGYYTPITFCHPSVPKFVYILQFDKSLRLWKCHKTAKNYATLKTFLLEFLDPYDDAVINHELTIQNACYYFTLVDEPFSFYEYWAIVDHVCSKILNHIPGVKHSNVNTDGTFYIEVQPNFIDEDKYLPLEIIPALPEHIHLSAHI